MFKYKGERLYFLLHLITVGLKRKNYNLQIVNQMSPVAVFIRKNFDKNEISPEVDFRSQDNNL